MASTKITLDDGGYLLDEQNGDNNSKQLYICSLYKVGGHVPYAEDWPEGDLKDWVEDWAILQVEQTETYPDSDERLRGENLLDKIKRNDEGKRVQGIYKGHQLYTFVGDATAQDNHEVLGFWEKVHKDVERLSDEEITDPPLPSRGP